MKDYVIKVYDEVDDTEPVRTYKTKANSIEEAVINATQDSAEWEKRIDADPVPPPLADQ